MNYIVLAIEHAKGGTLGDLIKKRQQDKHPLKEEECAKAIKAVCQAVKHIHSFDYLH